MALQDNPVFQAMIAKRNIAPDDPRVAARIAERRGNRGNIPQSTPTYSTQPTNVDAGSQYLSGAYNTMLGAYTKAYEANPKMGTPPPQWFAPSTWPTVNAGYRPDPRTPGITPEYYLNMTKGDYGQVGGQMLSGIGTLDVNSPEYKKAMGAWEGIQGFSATPESMRTVKY